MLLGLQYIGGYQIPLRITHNTIYLLLADLFIYMKYVKFLWTDINSIFFMYFFNKNISIKIP